MKQSNNLLIIEIFLGSDILRNLSFKTIETRDNSALLARENHNLSMTYDRLEDICVLFQIKDCFECLSPQLIVA